MSIRNEGEKALGGIRSQIAEKMKAENNIRVGYQPPKKEYKEGDVWEFDGKTWTIRNGIRQTISKLEGARIPLWCPECSVPMTHRFDTKMYGIHKKCFNCVITMETKLRIEGKFEEYEANFMKNKEIGWLKYHIEMFEHALTETSDVSFVMSNGEMQKWSAPDKDTIKSDIEKNITTMKERLAVLEENNNV